MTSSRILELLDRGDILTPAVSKSVGASFTGIEDIAKGQKILGAGDATGACHLLLSGVAFRHLDSEASRQITTFLLPGDWSDVHGLFYPKVSYSITTLTACQFAVIDHPVLSRAMDEHPSFADFLWRATLREAAIEREWVQNIGQRTDEERIAHLLAELVVRFGAHAMCDEGQRCVLPLTGLELAQCTGCSREAVDGVLRKFQGLEALKVGNGELTVIDVGRLKTLGLFDASYLELPVDAQN